uniref:Uncharacterized protein n=1 Tax=Knipowitschia caucasica TaxID=637954 RepID=A0AAV2LDI8_KNICA
MSVQSEGSASLSTGSAQAQGVRWRNGKWDCVSIVPVRAPESPGNSGGGCVWSNANIVTVPALVRGSLSSSLCGALRTRLCFGDRRQRHSREAARPLHTLEFKYCIKQRQTETRDEATNPLQEATAGCQATGQSCSVCWKSQLLDSAAAYTLYEVTIVM